MFSSAASTDFDWTPRVLLVIVAIVLLFAVHVVRTRNLPPGPIGVPVLGVLPFMGKKPYLKFMAWWNRYGDVYSLYMGTRLVVVLNGVEAIKECMVKQADTFSARPWNYFKKITKGTGIVFTEGEVWKEHRRFTLCCLRDFGMGKVSLEEKIHEEAAALITEILKEDGKPFDIHRHLPKAVSNIICSIIYGSRFDYNDEVFKANVEALHESVRAQVMTGIINFLPFLEFIPKLMPKIMPQNKMIVRNIKKREEYAEFQFQKHRESFDPENPRDFIDAYLIRMQYLQKQGDPSYFEEKQLKRTIQDLFIAGSETVTTTLKWALLFMMLYPDVQDKVQKQIDEVVGFTRMPSMKDRPRMTYVEAVILECQRVGNIGMTSVPRATTRDTTVSGYRIPKGTWIFVNRWGLHVHPKYWKNSKKFDPNRFIDENGHLKKQEAFSPFGVGPRSCLGESLAKMELFVFFTTLLQRFKFCLPKRKPIPSVEPVLGLTMCPAPYEMCAIPR